MRKLIIYVCVAAIVCGGCKKTNPTSSIQLISQISQTSGSTTSVNAFTYDDKNRVTEYSTGNGSTDYKFVYDGNDRITEQDYSTGSLTTQYLYNYTVANTITANITTKLAGVVSSTSTDIYTLSSDQRTSKLDYGNGVYSLYSYDGDGNLANQYDYTKSLASVSYQFSYSSFDQKNSPYFNIVGNFFVITPFSHQHNSLLETYTSFTANSQLVTTYTSTFEYDSNGFPTKETRVTKSSSGALTTAVITYSYIFK